MPGDHPGAVSGNPGRPPPHRDDRAQCPVTCPESHSWCWSRAWGGATQCQPSRADSATQGQSFRNLTHCSCGRRMKNIRAASKFRRHSVLDRCFLRQCVKILALRRTPWEGTEEILQKTKRAVCLGGEKQTGRNMQKWCSPPHMHTEE